MSENKWYKKVFCIKAISSLHVGAGQGVGFIDLPIMREKVTNWPIIPGSTIKGVLADYYGGGDDKKRQSSLACAFGKPGTNNGENGQAGQLIFTDAQIFCFPVRSLFGVFAWVTCPTVLKYLNQNAGIDIQIEDKEIEDNSAYCCKDSALISGNKTKPGIYLEELELEAKFEIKEEDLKKLKNLISNTDSDFQYFKKRFLIVNDNLFSYLIKTSTEVRPRIKIGENGIVLDGALWYEEYLPTETLLIGQVWVDISFSSNQNFQASVLLEEYCTGEKILQIGGNASVGKGLSVLTFNR